MGAPPRLIRELLRPEAYDHLVGTVELRETHISWVLLAGDSAYKIKKPLDLGFLDFSTFERREAACQEELRLNRRLAPDVYLGMVDVVERDGAAHVGGAGRVLERAVQMRRLPEAGMLPGLLEKDQVEPAQLRRLARRFVEFHRQAATGPGVDEHGSPQAVAANWTQNFEEMAPLGAETIPQWEFDLLWKRVAEWLQEGRARFARRVREGRIREGHGDLHSGSLCVVGEQIIPFDCLEFSPRYRCADVAAEIAFLAMDLEQAGRPDLAWHFATEYARRAGDPELLDLLPFYTCYRAFVRGKVVSLRLRQEGLDAAEAGRWSREARSYFYLALRAAQGGPPRIVVVSGLPGSGKSWLADELARRQGMLVLSTDVVRKRLAGHAPSFRAEAPYGAGLYGAEMTTKTYAALRAGAARWARRGVSVVLDGTYGDPRQRQLARATAQRVGAVFQLVLVESPEAVRRERIAARERDPNRISDADWGIAQRIGESFVEPTELAPSELFIDATGGGGAGALIESWYRP